MNRRQKEFVVKYATEIKSEKEWAEIFQVSRETISRWRELFKSEINEIIESNLAKYHEMLQKAGGAAVAKLVTLMQSSKNEWIQQSCAIKILDCIGFQKFSVDLNAKVKHEINDADVVADEDVIEYAEFLQKKAQRVSGEKNLN